ncbi:hypothetical protein K474DRAFT_1679440 [Panus rudis PR-1116 ss-1]|nr:hypothetical protein K474DRAFT_1679440 [Panus rudis PR-1116 ss-1]
MADSSRDLPPSHIDLPLSKPSSSPDASSEGYKRETSPLRLTNRSLDVSKEDPTFRQNLLPEMDQRTAEEPKKGSFLRKLMTDKLNPEEEKMLETLKPLFDNMTFKGSDATCTKESHMYPHLINIVNAVLQCSRERDSGPEAPTLLAFDTSAHSVGNSVTDTMVDACIYDVSRHITRDDVWVKPKVPNPKPGRTKAKAKAKATSPPDSSTNIDAADTPPLEPVVPTAEATSAPTSRASVHLSNAPVNDFSGSSEPILVPSNADSTTASAPLPLPAESPVCDSEQGAAGDNPANSIPNPPVSVPTPYNHADFVGRCIFSLIRFFVEVKFASGSDAYGPDDILPDGQPAKQGRGQIAEYAGEVFEKQHRTHFYSFYVYRNYFRLQRWDRNGMLMSTREDYKDEPMKLLRCIYRLARMSDEEAGYDTTAVAVTPSDPHVTLMKRKIAQGSFKKLPAYIQQGVKDAMRDVLGPKTQSNGIRLPIYKVQVPYKDEDFSDLLGIENAQSAPEDQPKMRQYLIGRPNFKPVAEPFGRGTKGFIAFDIEKKDFVFLKDAWREYSANPEADVYRKLKQHKVEYIAMLRCGGDLPGQHTTTNQHLNDHPVGMVHHRLVVVEIGQHLETYYNSSLLCFYVRCALIAHKQAWENANILHRDISDNNIIIAVRKLKSGNYLGRGLLIDWDLSKTKDQLESGTGTWRFLSAPRLEYPGKRWELMDDLEAFVHLINILTLRFHEHNVKNLAVHMSSYYDDCSYDPTIQGFWGCESKIESVQSGRPGFALLPIPENQNLRILINRLMQLCRLNWESLDFINLERHRVTAKPARAAIAQEFGPLHCIREADKGQADEEDDSEEEEEEDFDGSDDSIGESYVSDDDSGRTNSQSPPPTVTGKLSGPRGPPTSSGSHGLLVDPVDTSERSRDAVPKLPATEVHSTPSSGGIAPSNLPIQIARDSPFKDHSKILDAFAEVLDTELQNNWSERCDKVGDQFLGLGRQITVKVRSRSVLSQASAIQRGNSCSTRGGSYSKQRRVTSDSQRAMSSARKGGKTGSKRRAEDTTEESDSDAEEFVQGSSKSPLTVDAEARRSSKRTRRA